MESTVYQNLQEALKDLNWKRIGYSTDPVQEIQNYFDPFVLDDDGTPKITAKHKTVFICDNIDWNETYLIDIVANVLKDNDYVVGDYDLIYCDNPVARNFIENRKSFEISENDIKNFEKQHLSTMMIVINPEKNIITSINDKQFTEIDSNQIEYLLGYLDNNTCAQRVLYDLENS